MKAEIITIGDELLIGQTVNTNASWMGAELSSAGFEVLRITSVSDRRDEIISILNESSERSDVVLITGGLGPTSDDITKNVLCEFFGAKLVRNPRVLEMITEMLKRRSFPLNENNMRQADVPDNCKVLYNESGTAPGMWFEKEGRIFVSMPGVPLEMKYLMSTHVMPELRIRFTSQVIIHKNIMTYGMPEARLAEVLTGFEAGLPRSIKLAYLPSLGVIKLRLTGKGSEKNLVADEIEKQKSRLYSIIPDLIFAEDEEPMEAVIGRNLRNKNQTLATAESCTGGNIARLITSIPGSSDYFKGSVVAYDNGIKTELLGVDNKLISEFGAVSKETVETMAAGVKNLLKTDWALAVSGIAGPSGGTDNKPVGTIWIAVSGPAGTISRKFTFGTDRIININRSSIAALHLLLKQITGISEK